MINPGENFIICGLMLIAMMFMLPAIQFAGTPFAWSWMVLALIFAFIALGCVMWRKR